MSLMAFLVACRHWSYLL